MKKPSKTKEEIITKNMNFEEILKKNPNSAEILFNSGLHCVGCMMAMNETLEQGCKAHGMSKKQIDELVKKLNKGESVVNQIQRKIKRKKPEVSAQ